MLPKREAQKTTYAMILGRPRSWNAWVVAVTKKRKMRGRRINMRRRKGSANGANKYLFQLDVSLIFLAF
jgi:hypothetical protein